MIFDINKEVGKLFIGNPVPILFEKIGRILWNEFSNVQITINNIDEIIKRTKERVKNEVDREIEIHFPYKKRLKTGFSFGDPFASLTWMEDSNIRIIPKNEDKKINELFHTFPIGGY